MKKLQQILGLIFCGIKFFINKCISQYKSSSVKNNGGAIISSNTHLMNHNNIYIGRETYINGGYIIAGENSKIVIGNNCLISYNVHIRTNTHNYRNSKQLIRNQGNSEKDIIIGNDVWVGFGAQIMPGIEIGDGAVIGAGAVVTHNVEKYGIVCGIPAKKIGKRTNE